MNRIVFLISLILVLCLTSCDIVNAGNSSVISGTEAESTDNVTVITETEALSADTVSFVTDGTSDITAEKEDDTLTEEELGTILSSLKKSNIVNMGAEAEKDFQTLYQLTGTGIAGQNNDINHKTKCAVLKIVVDGYDFYLTVYKLGDNALFTGHTILKATVSEVIENFNGSDVSVGEKITVWQDMYINPGDAYMKDLAGSCGDGNINSLPEGDYKIDLKKLNETGINRIVTSDVPLLDLGVPYYVFVITNKDNGNCFCEAYCDGALNPAEISDIEENHSYSDDYKRLAEELAQMIREK